MRRTLGIASVLVVFLTLVPPAYSLNVQVLVECLQPSGCDLDKPALSPDGTCLAFMRNMSFPPDYRYWPQLWIEPVEGGRCEMTSVLVTFDNYHSSPAWSPDGTHLAFISLGFDRDKRGLWTLDVREPQSPNAMQHLVAGYAQDPAWSPDGSTIAYTGSGGIWTIPATGGVPTLAVSGGFQPSCGPDGQIVFERVGDLWIREADGTERQLTSSPISEQEPAWSPQGNWIAYVALQEGNADIWVIASHGGTPVRLTATPDQEHCSSWPAPDRIVFVSTLNQQDRICLATELPDWTTPVSTKTWSAMKQFYR